ncbi:hypothetical protein CMI37_36740 [Candidatus Pacearchaeota archaeon]|nr:hypothetical protein [Candidatus Pacearchaeota archaeon]
MKPQSVKTKVNRLVKHFGSRRGFAKAIGVELSYVYKLERYGFIPGKHLYAAICEMHRGVFGGK